MAKLLFLLAIAGGWVLSPGCGRPSAGQASARPAPTDPSWRDEFPPEPHENIHADSDWSGSARGGSGGGMGAGAGHDR